MKVLRRRDSEALVDGRSDSTDAAFGAVESFLDDLRLEGTAMAAPEPRPKLAATLDGRRLLPTASNPTDAVRELPRRRSPWPGRLRPAVAAIAGSAVLFGGLAGANALPRPLQRMSAELGSHVGIHLPGASHAPPAPRPKVRPDAGTAHEPNAPRSGGASTTTSTRPTTAPAVPTTTRPVTIATPGLPPIPSLPIAIPSPTTPTSLPSLPTLPLPIVRPIR